MKILLIQPPHYYNGKSREPAFFPLGLGYIAKVLLKSGYDVEVLDIWAHQYASDEVIQKIKELDYNYNIVGISALSTQYKYVKWLTKQLKKYGENKIMVGGALPTHSPEIVLKNTETDICVIGEGEITCKEVVENITNLEKVKGIYFKQNGEIFKNPPREYIKNLDSVEFPAWDLFPIDIYLKHCAVYWRPHIKALNVITSRGCSWNCKFCSKTFKQVRLRTVDNVIQEIKELKDRYDIKGIFFNDELLMVSKKRVYELCDKIEELNIKWNCQGRVNLVDFDLLKRMKKAGCVAVGYGIESGSQTILNNMNKQVTIKQAEKALEDTVKAGIDPIVQMMYGYLGETKQTLQETVEFFKKIPYTRYSSFSVTTSLPGSELYDYSLREGLITDEERYLEQLSAGYQSDRRVLVNLTSFSEEEFYQFKHETESKIFKMYIGYLLRHPLFLFREMRCLVKYGCKYTLSRVLETLNRGQRSG